MTLRFITGHGGGMRRRRRRRPVIISSKRPIGCRVVWWNTRANKTNEKKTWKKQTKKNRHRQCAPFPGTWLALLLLLFFFSLTVESSLQQSSRVRFSRNLIGSLGMTTATTKGPDSSYGRGFRFPATRLDDGVGRAIGAARLDGPRRSPFPDVWLALLSAAGHLNRTTHGHGDYLSHRVDPVSRHLIGSATPTCLHDESRDEANFKVTNEFIESYSSISPTWPINGPKANRLINSHLKTNQNGSFHPISEPSHRRSVQRRLNGRRFTEATRSIPHDVVTSPC